MLDVQEENKILRELLWLNHGHTGMYGDDGEMQCAECLSEYGFWDWKVIPADEIKVRFVAANIRKFADRLKGEK
jgi:hypothetical protein